MGLDYGERRIGVAVSDVNQIIASGYMTIDCRKNRQP
ncbi:Holliday junction resolvase RuvX, partial [Fibrobacterota bacterium]